MILTCGWCGSIFNNEDRSIIDPTTMTTQEIEGLPLGACGSSDCIGKHANKEQVIVEAEDSELEGMFI